MTFDKEFKEAVLNLPTKEKDTLLLRLLKKDLVLIDKLRFELISNISVDEARVIVAKEIQNRLFSLKKHEFNPGWFMMEMRYLSGDITYHLKTTKDKFGEVSLNILLLNKFLEYFSTEITHVKTKKNQKLIIYIISKAFRILINIQALHQDYFLDFEDDLKALGEKFSKNHHLMQLSIYNGFDVNWLLQAKIPEKIKEIHKEIRVQGFLR